MLKRRILGRTGLEVSEISLGTVELGMSYGIPDGGCRAPTEREAARLLHYALDLGINFIDTARAYGDSEAIIGRALKGRRQEFILASKVSASDPIAESVHESLRTLQTDMIDIMMIHSAPTEVIRQGAIVHELGKLRDAGSIRFIGASVYGNDAALLAVATGQYDCLQIAYSPLDRRPELVVLPAAEQTRIGIIARSVLLKGVLTFRYHHLPNHLARLKEAAERLEALSPVSLPELAYRYILQRNPPHTALIGTSRIEELEDAIAFANAGPLPEALVTAIRGEEIEDEQLLNPGRWNL